MGKIKKNKKSFFKTLAVLLVSVFSCFALAGCIGGTGGMGTGGSSSGSGSVSKDPPKFENEYEGKSDEVISDYNSVFLGAIGVYDIDNSAKAFYDNYTSQMVNFDYLINRQFTTLATVIYNSLVFAYGDGTFNGNIENYGSNSSFAFDNVVTTQLYNEQGTLKYLNSINGGYLLERIESELVDDSGNTILDENGQPMMDISYQYSASQIVNTCEWRDKNFSINSICNALRYIYVHPYTVSTGGSSFSLGTNAGLINYYSGFNSFLDSNEDISTIGYSEEYMYNVLYYVAYSIIGESNIHNSIDGASIVFNGNTLNTVNDDNYEIFQKYKSYEKILPELISNAFKLIINGSSVSVGSYYCFDLNNYNYYYNSTLYPILERNEYLFFDDLKDICDAEQSDDSSSGGGFDFDNLKPGDIEQFDPDNVTSNEELMNKTIKVGSLRKIKKIILIPKITESKYNKANFNIDNLVLCFSTSSGECEIEIITNVVDESGKKYNNQLKFDDGSYSITLPDGTIVDNDTKNPYDDDDASSGKDEMVLANGHLKVQNVPSVNKYSNWSSIFGDSETAESYKFSSVSKENIIRNAFKNDSYDVSTTGEKINVGRMKVCNQLFKMTETQGNSLNGVDSSISINENDNNYIEFLFKYYSNGVELSDIPPLYMLDFSL